MMKGEEVKGVSAAKLGKREEMRKAGLTHVLEAKETKYKNINNANRLS